jgi:hypothetical protein
VSTQALATFLPLLAVIALGASLLRAKRDRQHLQELRAKARDTISKVQIEAQDPRLALDASVATLERLEETGGARGLLSRVADLSITAYLCNEFGERFMVKWHSHSSAKPYVEHLELAPDFRIP